MARELSEEEKRKKEHLTAERAAKQKEQQAKKEQREREELERLNARLRTARKAKRRAVKDDLRDKQARFFSTLIAPLKQVFRKTKTAYDRLTALLSLFAAKKIALPVFIFVAFFCLWLNAYVGGYNLFHLTTKMQFTFYQFYLCDFFAGFCSRVIVGAVTGLFLDTVSIAQMTEIAKGAVIVSLILYALIIGAVLRKGVRERAFVPVLMAAVMLFEPIIVQVSFPFLGTLDVYILILFLCVLWSYGTPVFYVVAPVCSVLGLLVHYHYLLTFFPAVIALFVYEICMEQKKSRRIVSAVSFGFTAVSTCSLFFYLVLYAKNHLKCTADEFFEHMMSRFDISPAARSSLEKLMGGNAIFRDYFDYYIFGYYKGEYYYNSGGSFIELLSQERQARTAVSLYEKYVAYTLPVFVAFFVLWAICISRQKGLRRLPYIAFACIVLALFPELFISSDVPRWFAMTLTCQFALLFAVYRRGDTTVCSLLGSPGGKTFAIKLACLLCAGIYVTVMMYIGRDLPIFY